MYFEMFYKQFLLEWRIINNIIEKHYFLNLHIAHTILTLIDFKMNFNLRVTNKLYEQQADHVFCNLQQTE